ncbi:hypothetical protein [Virgibacillus salexigens]|uniref:Uncharacterized protein n=1 Tax=Virgibacillus massiliensis TaxID=1462526 RepID=A0A024QH36_9BACI|nr:hypothetical protein [Virgibacillus massiliensis]CDQ41824.1 hypothetical protein BN990_04201 [Virgibacillus massiliensis]
MRNQPVKDSHIDRLFKTFTFQPEFNNQYLRLKAIDLNNQELFTLHRKIIDTGISEENYNPNKDIFRLRSKLSMATHGVKESHWVTHKHFNEVDANDFNHFRIRGVSNTKVSDWVYSNIKGIDNETILFELLHDIIDVLLTANDSNLEYTINSTVEDAIQVLFKDKTPLLNRNYDKKYNKSTVIEEVNSLISSSIKKGLHEDLIGSVNYFAELVRSYKLLDRFNEDQEDFVAILLESFLDDQLDRIIQETEYEAILRNEEEITILLQGIYELEIKNAIITSLYNSELNDSFVSCINDAVKLISEPIVYEEIVYKKNEQFYNLFKSVLSDIYLPFLIVDQQELQLNHEMHDINNVDTVEQIGQYELIKEKENERHILIKDIIDLLLDDCKKRDVEYHVDFSDLILTPLIESKIGLWIDYAPTEFIEVLSNIHENLTIKRKKLNTAVQLDKETTTYEVTVLEHNNVCNSLESSYISSFKDRSSIISTNNYKQYQESFLLEVIDSILVSSITNKNNEVEIKELQLEENLDIESSRYDFIRKALQKIMLYDHSTLDITVDYSKLNHSMLLSVDGDFINTYKTNIYDQSIRKIKDHLESEVLPMPYDIYTLTEEESVVYFLGDLNGDITLGDFILGTNTLKGQ